MSAGLETLFADINHAHLFCGLGGGAKGFNRGEARVGNLQGRYNCLGGIDVDPASCRDFERNARATATCLDLFSREQYVAFHGKEPPGYWCEAGPSDIKRAFGNRRPHILFLSAPCKGFSGLLSERLSGTSKYQALNALTLRGIWLALEAYADDPIELIVFENVPRIATRGRALLDQIVKLLRAYGYAVAETAHDCGELGHLAQSRKRFLLVARHAAKIPNFLYEPIKHPLRGVGEVLEKLPLPLSGLGGPMHRMPALQWQTWVRLAFVEAGSDWRSLNKLRVADGVLQDFGIVPEYGRNGTLGVAGWAEPSCTVRGESRTSNGAFSVADPRIEGHEKSVQLGVRGWGDHAPVVRGNMAPGAGPNAVADPRIPGAPRFNSTYRIVAWAGSAPAVAGPGGPAGWLAVADPRVDNEFGGMRVTPWERHSGAVTGQRSPGSSAMAVADPHSPGPHLGKGKYRVTGFKERAGTVIAASTTGQGAFAVADPRLGWTEREDSSAGKSRTTSMHYGVVRWGDTSRAVAGAGQHDNGPWSVADPRESLFAPSNEDKERDILLAATERLVCVIRALDGTWHRPFTTLELAALQGLVDPEETLELDGLSDSAWRERIGNAVPPPAAQAIAGVMGRALLAAWSGETFSLSNEPIWVRPIATALMAAR